MPNLIITSVLLLGITLGLVGVASPYIAQPILYETKCSIQVDAYEIDNKKYWIEMQLLNNGDNTIINYSIKINDWTLTRNEIIQSGDIINDEFSIDNFDGGFIEVIVNTEKDNAICGVMVK